MMMRLFGLRRQPFPRVVKTRELASRAARRQSRFRSWPLLLAIRTRKIYGFSTCWTGVSVMAKDMLFLPRLTRTIAVGTVCPMGRDIIII